MLICINIFLIDL